jgi:acyl-ACP thioesterase
MNQPTAPPVPGFLPVPARGRVFSGSRVIAGTDVTPGGRLRLDALVRFLQQIAEEDVLSAGLALPYDWLVRKYTIVIGGCPARGERVEFRTFCSGTGPRWAERATTLTSTDGDDLIQARGVWVAVTQPEGRACAPGEEFHRVYGEAAQGRRVSARLAHPAPPGKAAAREWPLRASDFDIAGHVNNAVHWAAVEDVLTGVDWLPVHAEMEYRSPILPGQPVRVAVSEEPGQLRVWLLGAESDAGPGSSRADGRGGSAEVLASAYLAR